VGPPIQVVIDCADPDRLAGFWAVALGYVPQPPPDGYASWEDWLREQGIPESDWNSASSVEDPDGKRPRLYFQRVPERKTVKNRVHIDVNVGGPRGTPLEDRKPRVAEHVKRLVVAGAIVLQEVNERGEHWVVMQDPEGNEFCVQ